jgi:hypothetical protein
MPFLAYKKATLFYREWAGIYPQKEFVDEGGLTLSGHMESASLWAGFASCAAMVSLWA